ncbi:fatty acyl-CoA reductase wat-like isoform X2 [Zophobas morio]|uniref:fatty acyl-CoA reductase wat-like isoform X2 n=1 Tax=Zophobas morio TaxID=2755281 RepID=UPI003082F3D0
MSDNSQIVEFFKNQTIFITGGNGLVGKLILEKLLRTCWDLKKIYLLMRPKKGKSPEQRFSDLFTNPCFESIKGKNFKSKVVLICGDCNQPGLGINSEDVDILKKETTCIFHIAANVNFLQTIKEASYIVSCTKEMIKLAKEMANLKVFAYVSTAYSNCLNRHIREEIYAPPIKAEEFLDLVNSCNEDDLENTFLPYLKNFPNNYVFSKCLSEDLIKSSTTGIPTAIIRPAIITNTIKEPIPGYTDNYYGVIGVVAGAYIGIIRCFYTKKGKRLDLVPADVVSNCILAATWKTANSKSLTVYNCVGKKILLEKLINLVTPLYEEFPSTKYLWYTDFTLTESKFLYNVSSLWYLSLAHVVDFVSSRFGKSYGSREWTFDENNFMNLWFKMGDTDRRMFPFHSKTIPWHQYLLDCALGIRLYLLQDPISTLSKGKAKLKILRGLHYAFVGFIILCCLRICRTFARKIILMLQQ